MKATGMALAIFKSAGSLPSAFISGAVINNFFRIVSSQKLNEFSLVPFPDFELPLPSLLLLLNLSSEVV